MDINIPEGTKIIVLEGVPGAGKTTLHNKIKESLEDRLVYDFHEEELLWSWKHGWIPGIEGLRMDFMEHFLKYCEEVLAENSNAIFILNRFHVSYYLFAPEKPDTDPRYANILQTLKNIGVHIYVPLISAENIEKRASHVERKDPVWQAHLQKRLAQKGFANLTDMYEAEQKKIQELLEVQGLPYTLTTIQVDANA